MEYILGGVGLLIGIMIGWLLGTRKSGVSKAEFELLLKQEAAAQEKIKNLLVDLQFRQESNSKDHDQIINLNKEIAQLQARYPQLEQNLLESKSDKENLKTAHAELSEKYNSISSKASL